MEVSCLLLLGLVNSTWLLWFRPYDSQMKTAVITPPLNSTSEVISPLWKLAWMCPSLAKPY